MKIDRLIGILSLLLQKDQVTAPELAEKFQVTRRTISRDIDALCGAGIPIVTRQGVGGGISIMESFKLDRTVLTGPEMKDILAGLRGLDSIHGTNHYRQLMEKLSADESDFLTGDQSILIDLSGWDQESLTAKIQKIRSAIDCAQVLDFTYYSPTGESHRSIEPYYLIFRWSNWYLWGWCQTRKDFRLFKLNRMDDVVLSEIQFEKRAVPMPDLRNQKIFPGGIAVKILFEPSCKWRLIEEFGPDCYTVQRNGQLLFQTDFTNEENLLTWLLTFREQAQLLEPANLRNTLRDILKKTITQYEL